MDLETKDIRIVCKYGSKCYQKNQAHHEKYKHPVKRPIEVADEPSLKKKKLDIPNHNISDSDNDSDKVLECSEEVDLKSVEQIEPLLEESCVTENVTNIIPNLIDVGPFIKDKFLVEMPKDFYSFWEFSKKLNSTNPQDAFKDVGLQLVGPYDVLAQKFGGLSEPSPEKYLIHCRYYYDPPEFQTVLKGNDSQGYHIGYFRDDPKEFPVFLASNCANNDGVFKKCGGNIFAAVSIYLDDLKKTADVFKKMSVSKLQSSLRDFLKMEKWDLSLKNDVIIKRDRKIVTKTFNKLGLVVPYNKKTQLGYRELAMDEKKLKDLFLKLKEASDDQISNYLSDLQPVITYASIAADECDFGTGLELGLNILALGVERLNNTAIKFLTNSYILLKRDEFAKIAKAHLETRKNRSTLSII